MDGSVESSLVGLTIQCIGVVLVTTLSVLLTRSVRQQFLDYWAIAWTALTIGLAALLIAFRLPVPGKPFYTLYFFGEYVFGYLLVAGCRNYASGTRLKRRDAWLLVPAAVVAIAIGQLAGEFTSLLIPHSGILVGFWIVAHRALRPARRRERGRIGLGVVSVALVLLALDFLQYIAACSYVQFMSGDLPFPYLQYSSLYDLILEILLAFGTVLMVMEHLRFELERTNKELVAAGARLRTLAEKDPLTDALNRHAFYSFMQHQPGAAPAGSAAVIDVDDFKAINDTFGHAAGDAAIRTVARAIRSVIRSDDLLFRWGGDEFLIVLVGLPEAETRQRLERLNQLLGDPTLAGAGAHGPLAISYGVGPFTCADTLEQSIDRADQEMYRCKQARKSARVSSEPALHLSGV